MTIRERNWRFIRVYNIRNDSEKQYEVPESGSCADKHCCAEQAATPVYTKAPRGGTYLVTQASPYLP